jgi:hypothetical protein
LTILANPSPHFLVKKGGGGIFISCRLSQVCLNMNTYSECTFEFRRSNCSCAAADVLGYKWSGATTKLCFPVLKNFVKDTQSFA